MSTGDNYRGPLRVFPGRLSVSRAFGDYEAKTAELGGNPDVVIATPDIKYVDISNTFDFIFIGCKKVIKATEFMKS